MNYEIEQRSKERTEKRMNKYAAALQQIVKVDDKKKEEKKA